MRSLLNILKSRPRAITICRQCFRQLSTEAKILRNLRSRTLRSRRNLPDTPARTRFAPSPTGFLHLGSLRTALFNYLLAKSTGGQFLLRLEDTDQKRTVPDAEKRLYEDLRWAGLQWDEGPEIGGPHGPYKQSERTDIYREHAEKLVASGHAYRCFCTAERLAAVAQQRSALGLSTDYDRTCASISPAESYQLASKGASHVIRFKVPDVEPILDDIVYGKVGNPESKLQYRNDFWEDPILLKSDGFPTYNLANVVDDHHMRITHVIRGTEWMALTPKHLAMYEAFGWQPPQYAHVSLLTDTNGAKLSKRTGSTDIRSFRDQGILPQALTNFVALLGWKHQEFHDVRTFEELETQFDLNFNNRPAAINIEKLWFLQTQHVLHLQSTPDSAEFKDLIKQIKDVVLSSGFDSAWLKTVLAERSLEDYIAEILEADARNYVTPASFIARNQHFFTELSSAPPELDTLSWQAARIMNETLLQCVRTDNRHFNLRQQVTKVAGLIMESEAPEAKEMEEGYLVKPLYTYLRNALADGKSGLPVDVTMRIHRRLAVKRRLENYLDQKI